MKQKTIREEVTIFGREWFSGNKTWIKCIPSSFGITLEYNGVIEKLHPRLINFDEKRHTSSILIGDVAISMTEHLFAALYGLGIDNIHIIFGSKNIPFCASSSLFVDTFVKVGFSEINKIKDFIEIKEDILIKDGNKSCLITSSNDFFIESHIDFKNVIGVQNFSMNITPKKFRKFIAKARSFLIFEIDKYDFWKNIHEQFEFFPKVFPTDPKKCPFITYSKENYLIDLFWENEPVRHKTLDFIGDLAFLGKPIKGKFIISKTGHSFHREIIKIISDKYL